jgi:hemerythrin superfamily protein
MASATSDDSVVMDALALLQRDHRLAEQLFSDFERAADLQLDPLARRICKILKIHAQIEEEIFYPAARQALDEPALIDAAEAEHAEAKQLIARLEAISADNADFRPTMQALSSAIRAHVAEEEGTMFPRVHESELDLAAIGIALLERRHILMDVLGLHEDDEQGVTPRQDSELVDASRRQRAAERAAKP